MLLVRLVLLEPPGKRRAPLVQSQSSRLYWGPYRMPFNVHVATVQNDDDMQRCRRLAGQVHLITLIRGAVRLFLHAGAGRGWHGRTWCRH